MRFGMICFPHNDKKIWDIHSITLLPAKLSLVICSLIRAIKTCMNHAANTEIRHGGVFVCLI